MSDKILLFKILVFFALSLIFNISNAQVIDTILIEGNKETKDRVILNESGLEKGAYLDKNRKSLENAKENLINTSLFVTVNIDTLRIKDQFAIKIKLKERWYYWLYPILEHADRNFSSFLHSRDWKKINYGLSFEKHNFLGRNQFLKLKMRFGYREQIGFLYDNPQADKSGKHGFQFFGDRFRQRQIAIENQNDKEKYFYDENKESIRDYRLGAMYFYRPSPNHSLRLISEYHQMAISDTLYNIKPDFFAGNSRKAKYLSFKIQYENENRDNKYYPLEGHFIRTEINKTGTGIIANDYNFLRFNSSISKYWKISEKFYYNPDLKIKWDIINQNKIPYHMSGVLGYKSYPRGYEYYLVNGYFSGLLNQTLRYKLIERKPFKINSIPVEQFNTLFYSLFIYAFFDMAYSKTKTNSNLNKLPNKFLYSSGIGLDFQTFYDRTIGFHFAVTNRKGIGIFVKFQSPLYKIY